MFKWKRKHEGNKFEYTLVEDNGDVVFGSVVVTEDVGNGDITVIAECEEIGYKYVEEHSYKKFLKIMVSNQQKFIKEELEKKRSSQAKVAKMQVMETGIEIFLEDLKEDAQKKFLKAMGIETSEEGNYDTFPIAVVPVPEMDDGN